MTRWLKQQTPKAWRRRVLRLTRRPRIGGVDLGDFARLTPISGSWGGDRGMPVDRYYIERFLETHRQDIGGRVLEIADNVYTRRFGVDVAQSDVLHVDAGSPQATIVADLANADHLQGDQFDCIICTQTVQLIPDATAAVATLHRLLKPGGVLLITVPTISRLEVDGKGRWHDHWRFTGSGLAWLLSRHFAPAQVSIDTPGNVLVATAFLHGLAAEELDEATLQERDGRFELLALARAVKGDAA